jgi:hypothetical protein
MPWGGIYSGMELFHVSIVNLKSVSAPTATTHPATGVMTSGATLNGSVNPNGISTTCYFQWGMTAAYGKITSIQSAGGGLSEVAVSALLTGLSHNITHHYRLVATNGSMTTYGADMTFRTKAKGLPWLMQLLGN